MTVTTPNLCVRDISGMGGRVGIVNMSTIHDLSLAGVKKFSQFTHLLENCSSEGKLPRNENVGIGNVSFL